MCRLESPVGVCADNRRNTVHALSAGDVRFDCNRETPSSNRMRSRNETCVYENHASQPPRQHLGHGQTSEPGLAQESREPHYPIPIDRHKQRVDSPSHPSMSLVPSSTSASTRASQLFARGVESMKRSCLKRLRSLPNLLF